MLWFHGEHGDGILFLFWRIQANPNGINLLELAVIRAGKHGSLLPGKHPSRIVGGSFRQRVARIPLILAFHIDDDLAILLSSGGISREQNIIHYGSFRLTLIHRGFTLDPPGVRSILIYGTRHD